MNVLVYLVPLALLLGLGGLFAHPLGRNAFAVALKKLARQVRVVSVLYIVRAFGRGLTTRLAVECRTRHSS